MVVGVVGFNSVVTIYPHRFFGEKLSAMQEGIDT
jgi:hypothetical protein